MSDYIKELAKIQRYLMLSSKEGGYELEKAETGDVVLFKDIEELVQSAVETQKHTEEWYGVRFKRLREWLATTDLPEDKINECWNIVANGTKDAFTPPTYEQQMNQLKWELEKAQKRIEELEGES